MRQTRPPLVGRLLDRLPQPASPWTDTEDTGTRPVVLVHGTAGSRDNFEKIVPVLRETGRPVLSVSYGHRGTRELRDSLGEVVDQLAEITGRAGAVDLVGHSQGGLLALAATGILEDRTGGSSNDHNDDNAVVRHVVGLAADFRGVGRPWFRPPESQILHRIDRAFLPALADQLAGSPALDDVLRHTVRTDVPVTQIITRGDRIVPEARARALVAPDPLTGLPAHPGPVQVVTIQDRFPDARISHAVIPHHRVVGTLIAEALAANVTRPRNRDQNRDQTSVRRPQVP
ncbi:triacylglycerol lipase [Corynebacterium glyciniphilum]|uniref:esterase/lipase family protein n=1 Tax=Corynebacterium glyciniphilum TaxID=1404244 RepID=UPI00265614FC|nr:alpha/beta fold hydrolase [Corynebacterium glyciniphilum]MDN5682801.1 alpha/beta fold hydrolase [Corynebacterium glyciniphilum]